MLIKLAKRREYMSIHSMRIADPFTSNIYIKKLNWLPAKLNAESYFLARAGVLHPSIMRRGRGSGQEEIVSNRAAQQPSKTIKDRAGCSKNTAAARSDTEHWSPQAFQIPRHDGDEDEKGAVALKGNLRGAPWGVWIQETVHRLEPEKRDKRVRYRWMETWWSKVKSVWLCHN